MNCCSDRSRRFAALLALLVTAACALWKLRHSFADDGGFFLKHHYLVLQDLLNQTNTEQRFLRSE
jgi:hypothetical protein